MSRVGRLPIAIPQGVEAKIDGHTVHVKGPKGTLHQVLPESISAKLESGKMTLSRASETGTVKALHGLMRSLVFNMVHGVSQGYTKELEIIGVGFKAEIKGSNKIEFSLGFSHTVPFDLPAGVKAEVDKTTNILKIHGCDKHMIGHLAAKIRALKEPEPYKGKGIKYRTETLRRKAGKAAAGSASQKG